MMAKTSNSTVNAVNAANAVNASTVTYNCECGRKYNYRQGLYLHKRKCSVAVDVDAEVMYSPVNSVSSVSPVETGSGVHAPACHSPYSPHIPCSDETSQLHAHTKVFENTITKLIDHHRQVDADRAKRDESMLRIITKIGTRATTTTNTVVNNHNSNNGNNYNINMFLNDKCKDATNLVDFVHSIRCQLKDLEYTGQAGYVEGISKMLINHLSEMDITKRPIHCTDTKRNSMYIRSNDEWCRDNDHTHIRKAIDMVGQKNIQNINEWRRLHPEHNHTGIDNKRKQYMDIVTNSMVLGEDDSRISAKIIKNLAAVVAIDKGVMVA